jgi:Mitochondrial K+-H+ exchange-related
MKLILLPLSTKRVFLYAQTANIALPNDKQSFLDKTTTRAAALWVKWEGAEKGWQKKVTVYGNALLQRIPYEEWALKSIPPLSKKVKNGSENAKRVEVVFPASLVHDNTVVARLRTLATERQSLHKKRFWWSIVGMPISAPVALVPV